jgi:hypothetical protein
MAVWVLVDDRLDERSPALGAAEGAAESARDRVLAIFEQLVGEVLAQLATEVPLAQAMVGPGLAEDRLDRARQRVVGVRDDHPRRALEGAEEDLPGGLVLARERLQPPQARHRRPPARRSRLAAHRREDVKAAAGVLAGADAEVLAVDQERLGPAAGRLAGAQKLCEDVDPVGDELALAQRIAAALGPRVARAGRDATGTPARRLRGGPIGGAGPHRGERLTDLARREVVLARARLALPRLQAGRALDAEGVRLALARQDRREAMAPIPVRRATQPALPPMRRLPIPARPHHHRARVLDDSTLRNLHAQRP